MCSDVRKRQLRAYMQVYHIADDVFRVYGRRCVKAKQHRRSVGSRLSVVAEGRRL